MAGFSYGGSSSQASSSSGIGGATNNVGSGGFPFSAPLNSSNSLLYVAMGVGLFLLWKKK